MRTPDLAVIAPLILALQGCTAGCSEERSGLVIYSGRSAESVEALIEIFEQESGFEVDVRYDQTPTLAERLLAEGEQGPADVFLAQDSGYLGALGSAGVLQSLPVNLGEGVPNSFVGSDRTWIATSGRLRVLVYSPDRVSKDALPRTLEELTRPEWKGRVGWAPGNGSYQAHVSALREVWGEEKTREWLQGMQELEPTVYDKNASQVKAVANGEIDIGWVNHYYLHRLQSAEPDLAAANYQFPAGDAGNLMMLSGVAMTRSSDSAEEAEAFIRFLLSERAQSWFTDTGFEYPTVDGVELHAGLPALNGVLEVDQEALADVMGTRRLLDDLEIQ